ncbi:PREDICTED: uncharacterized protein LOC108783293 [Cyphomyrmex costatus]|uniref:uncharacterized protein LOC108783293 n=1 Tax=Cyphomyrmex costatus TaxID=456900 RepID=UPI0008524025|nr:PREDICTED: uncharacterized protein LOC108783293 [Cyphomyrmex costatus]
MVLLLRLTYAAVVWWSRAEKVEARNLLKSLQGGYLRATTEAMKTTPTEALQVALSIPPLNQMIKYTARQIAYRLKCQDVDTWFTDISGANGRYGTGTYELNINHEVSIPMGELAIVFQAEVLAILKCAKLLLKGKSRKQIYIYTDSRAAIEALTRTSTESSVVWDLPGHQGIPGNERADELAKLGTEKVPTEQIIGVPFSAVTKTIKEWLKWEHSNSWKEAEGCKRVK